MPAASATVRVTGGSGAQRDGFREHVRWLLVRDGDAPEYAEEHTAEHLQYRFAIGGGIPFPAFVDASQAFAGMRVEAQWPQHGRSHAGRVVFESGMVVEKVDLS